MKQKLIPIISIVFGIIAFVLTFQYLAGERKKLEKEWDAFRRSTKQITVMVAKVNIPRGTTIKRGDLGTDNVFKINVGDRAVLPDDAPKIFNRKALHSIKAANPILWTDIEGVDRRGKTLASIIQPGLRAVSISVGGASAVSSMVRPNDRIDILGTFSFPSRNTPGEMETVTLTVLQDVTVLATGQTMANQQSTKGRSRSNSGYSTVTLEVSPREAELLVFAQQLRGSLVLSLRNPSDVYFEKNLPEINFEYLEKEIPNLNIERQKTIRHKRNI
ncbi:MAG: Flp pilus assembly protein CpaB [Kiritimatiellae bacterium]|nr:Flp pilus assembly protein CpaB [Kiritimatiellia bacterium]